MGHVTKIDKDETGLAQWYNQKTILYQGGIDLDRKMVYEQQLRYSKKWDMPIPNPIIDFDKNLFALLSLWRMQFEAVILMIDVNQQI